MRVKGSFIHLLNPTICSLGSNLAGRVVTAWLVILRVRAGFLFSGSGSCSQGPFVVIWGWGGRTNLITVVFLLAKITCIIHMSSLPMLLLTSCLCYHPPFCRRHRKQHLLSSVIKNVYYFYIVRLIYFCYILDEQTQNWLYIYTYNMDIISSHHFNYFHYGTHICDNKYYIVQTRHNFYEL